MFKIKLDNQNLRSLPTRNSTPSHAIYLKTDNKIKTKTKFQTDDVTNENKFKYSS